MLEKGEHKGTAAQLNFLTATVDVTASTASIAEQSGAGGNGMPIGSVMAQDWRELVHTDDSGTWVMLNGRDIDIAAYPGAAACSAAVICSTEVPRMSADVTGVWTAKAGSVMSGSPAYMAFEGDDASFGNGWHSAAGSVNTTTGLANTSVWVQVTKQTPFKVRGYYIDGYNSVYNTIAAWRVLGSDDQVNFVTLDEQTDFFYGLVEGGRMNFGVDTSKDYRTYRLQILKTNIGTGSPENNNRTAVLRFGLWDKKVKLVDFGRNANGWPHYVKVK